MTPAPRGYRWLLGLVAAALCLPVLGVQYPPLVDYPNHLARVHILAEYDGVAAYRQAYSRVFEHSPNLAMDLIAPPLAALLDVYLAGRLFLVASVLLFVAGCHLLGRAIHGRPTWLALPCSFFVYNSMLLYGFVNYVFALGLFAVTLAVWLRWRARWTAPRLLAVSALCLAAYLAHLSAVSFLGVSFLIVAGWDLRRGADWKLAAAGLVPLLAPTAAFASYLRGGGETGAVAWAGLETKVVAGLSLLLSYDRALDVVVAAGLVAVLAALALTARRIGVSAPAFSAGAALAVLYLVSPFELFGSMSVDGRFVPPAAMLLLLSLRPELSPLAGRALLAAALALGAVRVAAIAAVWSELDARIAAEVERLRRLPEGAAVYPLVVTSPDLERGKRERAFDHVALYATIERQAYVPTLFAYEGEQPLRIRNPRPFATPLHEDRGAWLRVLQHYDYVWTYGVSAETRRQLAERCTVVDTSDGFTLWRVAGAPAPIGRVAGVPAPIGRVAGVSAPIGRVAGVSAPIGRVAGVSASIGRVAGVAARVREAR